MSQLPAKWTHDPPPCATCRRGRKAVVRCDHFACGYAICKWCRREAGHRVESRPAADGGGALVASVDYCPTHAKG